MMAPQGRMTVLPLMSLRLARGVVVGVAVSPSRGEFFFLQEQGANAKSAAIKPKQRVFWMFIIGHLFCCVTKYRPFYSAVFVLAIDLFVRNKVGLVRKA
jgi:hypothetical protein